MITRIHAENFKSWKDTGEELRLAPLTGLFGTNNSGKTSILQMLLLMKQTVESTDRRRVLHTGDDRAIVDLGTFSDLIYDHQLHASLRLSFSWELLEPLVVNDPESQEKELFNIRELSFTTVIRAALGLPDRLLVESFIYEFGNCKFGMLANDPVGSRYRLIHGDYPAKHIQDRVSLLRPPVKCHGFSNEATVNYQNMNFLPDFPLAFEEMLSRIGYQGPFRGYPLRIYPSSSQLEEGVKRDVKEEKILECLREMGLVDSISLNFIGPNRNYYEIRVKTSETSPEALITDVGFGISQVRPVLELCYYAPLDSIILLEQPEAHLHPSAQASLADVLIDVVKERHVQIIVESHSEHLLRRIQRRIAEEEISPDMVALYFCRMENGESKIEELDVDQFGNIRNWPQNFFGDEMGDLAAMTKAEMKRRKKAAHDSSG